MKGTGDGCRECDSGSHLSCGVIRADPMSYTRDQGFNAAFSMFFLLVIDLTYISIRKEAKRNRHPSSDGYDPDSEETDAAFLKETAKASSCCFVI